MGSNRPRRHLGGGADASGPRLCRTTAGLPASAPRSEPRVPPFARGQYEALPLASCRLNRFGALTSRRMAIPTAQLHARRRGWARRQRLPGLTAMDPASRLAASRPRAAPRDRPTGPSASAAEERRAWLEEQAPSGPLVAEEAAPGPARRERDWPAAAVAPDVLPCPERRPPARPARSGRRSRCEAKSSCEHSSGRSAPQPTAPIGRRPSGPVQRLCHRRPGKFATFWRLVGQLVRFFEDGPRWFRTVAGQDEGAVPPGSGLQPIDDWQSGD
jgi:hypothetical protein